jgi:predicted enzyme related to lactoylglutathione lyase
LTTWKPADKKAAPVTAEKMSADEVKLPPSPKSNGQSLGEAAEIALGVANLKDALAFYERLSFKKLSQREGGGENLSATLTDGSIIVTLNPGQTPALLLVYYAADMDQRIEELEKLGIVFDSKREGEAVFSDPNGLHVKLVKADASKLPKPAGKPFSKCGMFGELCVSTRDLKASLAFWDKAGFGKTHSESAPYQFAIVMDGKLIVGLHQGNAEIKAPTLTYFDRDSKARIAELKKAGVAFESEKGGGVLKSPDGQGVFLFNW